MKNLYLGYETAKWYWEHAFNAAQTLRTCSYASSLNGCVTTTTDVYEVVEGTLFEKMPLHVMTKQTHSNNSQNIFFHEHGSSFPKYSFVQLAPNIFIASPQLSFIQICCSHSFGQAFLYGCNLCGVYALSDANGYGVEKRTRIISVRRLQSFADENKGIYGLVEARKISKYLVNDSASPRETAAFGALTLPLMYGGMGLSGASLNSRIDIPKRYEWPGKRKFYVADIFWPEAKVAIEYDSDVAHAHRYGIYRDSEKRNTLISMGYTPLCITSVQLDNPSDFALVADVVRRSLGQRRRPAPKEYNKRLMLLRKEMGLPWQTCNSDYNMTNFNKRNI